MNPLYPAHDTDYPSASTSAAAAAAFALGEPFNSWDFSSIQDNIEAQKLLASAIEHNNQYRFDEDSKRKLELVEDIVTQLPTKASHNLNITSVPHHELSSQESSPSTPQTPTEQSFEPQKKKPGRKPLTNTPSSKRKAQNRAAQRAFRERKERYVKELETKIKELESQSAKSAQENQQLKTLVEQLQMENFILKQAPSFTFDFSLDKANENTIALDKSINDLVLPLQPTLPQNTPLKESTTGNSVPSPFTPPSSNDSDEESLHGKDKTTTNQTVMQALNPLMFNFNTPQTTSQSKPLTPPESSAASRKPQNATEFCKKLTKGMCPDGIDDDDEDEVSPNGNSSKTTTSTQNSLAFSKYRDPTPFTAAIDAAFFESNIPPLFEEDFEDFGSYAPMFTPNSEIKNPLTINQLPNGFNSLEEIRDKKYLSCRKVWEKLQNHPKYEDFAAEEINDLCNELKTKAKCSNAGLVVPEEEVDAALVKLEEGKEE